MTTHDQGLRHQRRRQRPSVYAGGMADARQPEKYLKAMETLSTEEERRQFEQLVKDYKEGRDKHVPGFTGISYNILADLIRQGWRK
jgi:hypothetical protein